MGGCGLFFRVRWVVLLERGFDERTGATVEISELGERWAWRVFHPISPSRGDTSSQKSARSAARRYVEKLADTKPNRQLNLFSK